MSNESQLTISRPAKPLLIVLSGLSGAGKDAVLNKLKESDFPLQYITTVTTRHKRAGERDKIDYHFVSEADFQKMIENSELLEWARVYDNWYGVPEKPVKQALEKGKDAIVRVDVQGATTIKKLVPQAVFIFLAPPSTEELILRLKQRNTESTAELELRIKTAAEELKRLPLFDYLVLNRPGEIDRAVSEIKAIISAEKYRVKPRNITLS